MYLLMIFNLVVAYILHILQDIMIEEGNYSIACMNAVTVISLLIIAAKDWIDAKNEVENDNL